MTEDRMIPLSVIDALIADLKNWFEIADVYEDSVSNMVSDGLLKLERIKEEIKKEAIVPNQSLSSSELQKENTMLRQLVNGYRREFRKEKKEEKTTEQRILNRIKELEAEYNRSAAYAIDNHEIRMGYQIAIDELRKLLSPSTVED